MTELKPPLPPFTRETAAQKVQAAEAKVEDAMHALDAAVAGLAVLVGPLAAAHACALSALDLSKQAEKEGRL